MKKITVAIGFVALFATIQVASATTITLADNAYNWDGWSTAPNVNNNVDGSSVTPNIFSTTVTMDADNQLEKILFNLKTYNYNVRSGDLFIDANSDKNWDYVVRALETSLNTPSATALNLYAINVGLNDPTKYEMSYYGDNVNHYRPGLPIGLKDTTTTYIGSVGYIANTTGISFDFGQYSPLYFSQDFTIGYTVTCANDVIYQQVPVPTPEPGTFALLGAGLVGLGFFARRRKSL